MLAKRAAAKAKKDAKAEYKRETLQARLETLLVPRGIHDWDVLLLGDGAGCSWDIGAGWGCVLIDRATMGRKLFWGAWSSGTVNIAEFMPYLHALMWYDIQYRRERQSAKPGTLKVHVFSDSEVTVNAGNRVHRPKDLSPLWAAWDNLVYKGYSARFHSILRETAGCNILCDELSRFTRQLVQGIEWKDFAPEGYANLYDINPDGGNL